MQIDPWILAFSAVTVIVTIWMGFRSARTSKTASDFFVAGRSVSVGWNASAISGEYLSAASFMGVAGMVMSSGYDALWYPVCYACGYLFLLLFIAGPLRRFGAYTIPDFAEGRFDSPLFRKIAVCFVLFIGFFYTMPQMKGAGTTLAYIFPGLPYWAGVVLVGAVITLNVALGGMKGITLVQAFQYWAKMFAISVPIFVLMAVYEHYGKQLGVNGSIQHPTNVPNVAINVESFALPGKSKAANGSIAISTSVTLPIVDGWVTIEPPNSVAQVEQRIKELVGKGQSWRNIGDAKLISVLMELAEHEGRRIVAHTNLGLTRMLGNLTVDQTNRLGAAAQLRGFLASKDVSLLDSSRDVLAVPKSQEAAVQRALQSQAGSPTLRKPLPEKAPADATWLSPFGPLTTKAAKAAKPRVVFTGQLNERVLDGSFLDAEKSPARVVRDHVLPQRLVIGTGEMQIVDLFHTYGLLRAWSEKPHLGVGVRMFWSPSLESKQINVSILGNLTERQACEALLETFRTNGVTVVRESGNIFKAFPTADATITPIDPKPYSLLYTYSLIIALVCGTAGLPHILVRFYTNPDGAAAKRTTMWVMILIGVFYVFPPVFGVMGRNLLPELYAGVGAKGTDKVVLELPRILNEQRGKGEKEQRGEGPATSGGEFSSAPLPPSLSAETNARKSSGGIPWGSILSGITCAGAFAAFMSTFSGLLVSMTGALAHDVYGRMLRPKSTPEQRMRMFRIGAVLLGSGAIIAGSFVEPLQINFMVGQAFAIAAASYFPLLFMSAWWRGMTMKGAATGMLTGGLLALTGISLTSFSDLALATDRTAQFFAVFKPLNDFWAQYPLLRILCEQPAIWTVPLAIALMVIVSKLTRAEVPSDSRMKMLVLHAPEKLGLKQEYIQEHQHGH